MLIKWYAMVGYSTIQYDTKQMVMQGKIQIKQEGTLQCNIIAIIVILLLVCSNICFFLYVLKPAYFKGCHIKYYELKKKIKTN